jgi:hypothetical protein
MSKEYQREPFLKNTNEDNYEYILRPSSRKRSTIALLTIALLISTGLNFFQTILYVSIPSNTEPSCLEYRWQFGKSQSFFIYGCM